MLHSNEFIVLTYQAEALRKAQQERLAREAQSKSHSPLYAQLAAVSGKLWTLVAQRGNDRHPASTLNTHHAG
jgi:hypothetical protein